MTCPPSVLVDTLADHAEYRSNRWAIVKQLLTFWRERCGARKLFVETSRGKHALGVWPSLRRDVRMPTVRSLQSD